MTKTIYSSLPEGSQTIRVVELLPGSPPDRFIRCRLKLRELYASNQENSYRALSYAWKNSENDFDVPIICNNQTIRVSSNLHAALLRLRDPERPIILWIDALCINQADDAERAQQVKMMRNIYENAIETLIWLGERGFGENNDLFTDNKDSFEPLKSKSKVDRNMKNGIHVEPFNQLSLADRKLERVSWYDDERDQGKIAAYCESHESINTERLFFLPPKLERSLPDIIGAFCLIHQLSQGIPLTEIKFFRNMTQQAEISRGLGAIMRLPWWRRTWVVQETVVAASSSIYFSNISAPWTMFSKAAANYARQRILTNFDLTRTQITHDPLTEFSRTILEIQRTRIEWNYGQPIPLLALLRKFRSREASDNRDKVFALGLVNSWGHGKPILPDYRISVDKLFFLTTVETIEDTAAKTFKNSRSGSGKIGYEEYMPKALVSAPSVHSEENSRDPRQTVLLQKPRHTSIQKYILGSSLNQAFWRTVCGDCLYRGATGELDGSNHSSYHRADKSGAEAFRAWQAGNIDYHRKSAFVGGTFLEYEAPPEIRATKNAFHYAVESASSSRVFFVTKKGYIGTGSPGTKAGDQIYVLLGSRVPFLLRPELTRTCSDCEPRELIPADEGIQSDGNCGKQHSRWYSLVGDCYTHGIMDGAVVRIAGKRSISPVSVYLV